MSQIGELLKELREKGRWSQRDVEAAARISRGYLSLIESGQRIPSASVIVKLARFYGVRANTLLEAAGYLEEGVSEEEELERAYQFVISDPNYTFGTNLPGELTPEVKRFIVEMYEKATGRKLL